MTLLVEYRDRPILTGSFHERLERPAREQKRRTFARTESVTYTERVVGAASLETSRRRRQQSREE